MASYTKGPWKLVTKFRDPSFVYGDAEIHGVTRFPIVDLEICDEETRANAHLIAAAPELLEALQQIAGMQSTVCQHCEGGGSFWADGKAHYPSENLPTVRCSNCGGSGRLAVDLEEVQNIANEAIAKAVGA